MTDPGRLYDEVREEVGRVLIGNEHVVEGLTVALLSDGHVLLEGVPGIAKTTAAELFARASGLEHTRIQMTPDVLPADITGTSVYREETGEFETRKGPIFANVVLADEINRATPKTQSALLEAMAERNVTIEGDRFPLPEPFLLVATQNPIEMEGTFVLAEAQRDRFQQKLTIDLPERDDERLLLNRFDNEPALGPETVEQVVSPAELLEARDVVADVHVAPEVKEYVLDLIERTREHNQVEHGASPRASLAFLQAGKARAAIRGRDYVIPDDIKALARPVLIHRLVLDTDAEIGGVDSASVVDEIVDTVEAPSGEAATETGPGELPDETEEIEGEDAEQPETEGAESAEPENDESAASTADEPDEAQDDERDEANNGELAADESAENAGGGAESASVDAIGDTGVDVEPGSAASSNEADGDFQFEDAAPGDGTGESSPDESAQSDGGDAVSATAETQAVDEDQTPDTDTEEADDAAATQADENGEDDGGSRSWLPW